MYYQGSSEIQADALQTLYLRNPNYVGYSDTQQQPPANMLFLNSTATTTVSQVLNSTPVPHAPLPQARQFVGIPLIHDSNRLSSVLGQQEEIQAAQNTIPRFHYSLWDSVDQATNGNQIINMPRQVPQGLSLSLAPHQTAFRKSLSSEQDFQGQSSIAIISPKHCSSPSISTAHAYTGVKNMQSVILGSKYLKAAQQLLDELANVGEGIDTDQSEGLKDKAKKKSICMNVEASSGGGESGTKDAGGELATSQRQEIQMKKTKLISMLDEVEQRYRQYHHQMQIVVASFEQAAGVRATNSYTQLAKNTISKQFRCLKDAISAQIKALSRSLGVDESSGEKFVDSRIKFVDHQLRPHKALQQLGMMQSNAWRTQRGLPERAVSVLRAWLFEHFLHPYPKDLDKQLLAKQTGLTRSQVSNWFINARVRLWKPMVEEMYLEEMKNREQTSSEETTTRTAPEKELASKFAATQENNNTIARMDAVQSKQLDKLLHNQVPPPTEMSASTVNTSPTGASLQARAGFAQLISSLNMENLAEKNPKKPRNDVHDDNSRSSKGFNNIKFSTEGQARESYLSMAAANTSSSQGTAFGTYGIGELGRFNAEQLATTGFHGNNNVTLTLALESSHLSEGIHQQNFLSNPRNFEFEIETGAVGSSRINGLESASHSNISYEILDFQNRKPFPAQLLPDFVA